MRDFSELSEREVLALAIGAEEEDGRIYNDLVERMREEYPATAKIFAEMAGEESEHRHKLLELYREKFGEHIPLVRRMCANWLRAWRQKRSGFTGWRPRARPMCRSANCWATWPRWNRSTSIGSMRSPPRT